MAAWPLITLAIFAKLPNYKAIAISSTAGYLLLPVKTQFEFGGFPDLGKSEIISISLLFGIGLFGRWRRKRFLTFIPLTLMATFIISPLVTAFLNNDPIISPKFFLEGMSNYDGISLMASRAISVAPYAIAASYFEDLKKVEFLLKTVILSLLFYSIPILFEIRFSPQLHVWIYGFFPHSFDQQMREGGFRSVVFLGHGLIVAIFLAMALVGAAGFARQKRQIGAISAFAAAIGLLAILILQKSFGALIIACLFCFMVAAISRRKQLMLAAIFGAIILSYPIFRSSSLFPRQTITQMAGEVSDERSNSLAFRLENEDRLLARGSERPMFGWGSWGRNRVFDLESGKDASVTDGTWIIEVGSFGWIGYLSMFGLLTYPIFHLASLYRKKAGLPPWQIITLAFVLITNLLDLLPNSSLTPITWLLAGALAGYKEGPVSRSHNRTTLLLSEQHPPHRAAH